MVTLISQRHLQAGAYQATWGGLDDRGQQVSSGAYLYRLQEGQQTVSRQMVLLK